MWGREGDEQLDKRRIGTSMGRVLRGEVFKLFEVFVTGSREMGSMSQNLKN